MAGEQKKGFLGGFKDWAAEATETLITDQWPNKNNSLRCTNELSCEEQPRPLRNLFFFSPSSYSEKMRWGRGYC